MKTNKIIVNFITVLMLCACENKPKVIAVHNDLDMERIFETIELTMDFLKVDSLEHLGVRDLDSGKLVVTQLVDENGDGIMDELLFQPKVKARSVKLFEVVQVLENERPHSENWCYSRFVPERTDDYAWENNKVAFRMFGPTAQDMVEKGIPGGTLSSGVDAWLKKVEYPIINKWYKKETETDGTYHEDTGEGLDNFHVGVSRGVGGIAIRKDSIYYFSKNYTKWRTITTGPLRTSFYLEIGDWDAGENPIKESKIISLDHGSNLSKFEVFIYGTDHVSAGLTLHEKDGKISINEKKGWVSYWQPHGNSELGTAIVTTPIFFAGHEKYDTTEKDLSNAYAHLKVIDGKTIYYAGFGWKENGQFKNNQDWEEYLNRFAEQISRPLKIVLVQ